MNAEDRHELCYMSEKCIKEDHCPMVLVQNLLSGKRKLLILWYLSNKVLRFNDFKKMLPDVTQKMLTQQLRTLEKDGLIYRNAYPVVPPKVEYGLTDLGRRIIPILELMHGFGAEYLEATQGSELNHEAEPQIENETKSDSAYVSEQNSEFKVEHKSEYNTEHESGHDLEHETGK